MDTPKCWYCGKEVAQDLAKRLSIDLPIGKTSGLTLEELADYVGLPADFLRSVGLSGGVAGLERTKAVDIP